MVSEDITTYCNALEVDGGRIRFIVIGNNDIGELRNVVACIALTSDEEVAAFELREPLKPVDEESVGVFSSPVITILVIIGARV